MSFKKVFHRKSKVDDQSTEDSEAKGNVLTRLLQQSRSKLTSKNKVSQQPNGNDKSDADSEMDSSVDLEEGMENVNLDDEVKDNNEEGDTDIEENIDGNDDEGDDNNQESTNASLSLPEMVQLPEIVDYDVVKNHVEKGTATVIDVREYKELAKRGMIEGSVNIPLAKLKDSLHQQAVNFEEQFSKSAENFPIIFSCSVGVRSAKAVKIAKELGYTNVANYSGGYEDWIQHSPIRIMPPEEEEEENEVKVVDYKEVKTHLQNKTAIIIDLREEKEIANHGKFEGALNVPFTKIEEALVMSEEEFQETFKAPKPKLTDTIIFSCMAGVRVTKAGKLARSMGYEGILEYQGSWQDWKAKKLQEEAEERAKKLPVKQQSVAVGQASARKIGSYSRGN